MTDLVSAPRSREGFIMLVSLAENHYGALIASNDDWKDTQQSGIAATGLGAAKRVGICNSGDADTRELHRNCARN
jgi:hypothetical protein